MSKGIILDKWEIRGNRVFLWYCWFSQTNWRKRPLVKVKCLECWKEQIILKESFLRGNRCNDCIQKVNHKRLADSRRSHWLWQTRFYHLYYTMKGRCKWYWDLGKKYYHDKWIKCEWKTFEDFKNDMYDSYLDHVSKYWEKQTTIDRIDNNSNYCKSNCRWATIKEQKRNTIRNRFYDFHWIKLCEQDIRNLTKEKRAEVRKKYKRI
jgi:DNA-directed RNA polymerase subunit RPC12/RpoP